SCSRARSNPRRTEITAPQISTTMFSATNAFDGFDGRRTTSAILIFRSRFARAPASRRLPLSRAPLRNCDAAHVNVPLVNDLPSANSVADWPLRPHSSIRSAQTASVLGFMRTKMPTIHALVKNGACASDTHMGPRKPLISPLPRLSRLRQHTVHRSQRRQIDASAEQRRVHLRNRRIDELRVVEHLAYCGSLCFAQPAGAWSTLNHARWRRGLSRAIQGRATETERLACRADRHAWVIQFFDQVHQLSPSSSFGNAIPRIACAFFCWPIRTSATCSLRSSSALRFSSSAIRRSLASSFALRPGLRPASAALLASATWVRHVDKCEL